MSEVIAADYGGVFGLDWQWQEGGRPVALGEFCSESSEGRLSSTVSGPECVTKKKRRRKCGVLHFAL